MTTDVRPKSRCGCVSLRPTVAQAMGRGGYLGVLAGSGRLGNRGVGVVVDRGAGWARRLAGGAGAADRRRHQRGGARARVRPHGGRRRRRHRGPPCARSGDRSSAVAAHRGPAHRAARRADPGRGVPDRRPCAAAALPRTTAGCSAPTRHSNASCSCCATSGRRTATRGTSTRTCSRAMARAAAVESSGDKVDAWPRSRRPSSRSQGTRYG